MGQKCLDVDTQHSESQYSCVVDSTRMSTGGDIVSQVCIEDARADCVCNASIGVAVRRCMLVYLQGETARRKFEGLSYMDNDAFDGSRSLCVDHKPVPGSDFRYRAGH